MKTITTIPQLKEAIKTFKVANKTIGFVPTMGALHKGHLSLVSKSISQNDITIVSVFVNPTQFNDPSDLQNYPRTLEKDEKLLQQNKCDILFAPGVDEMYPQPDTRTFDFGMLDKVMEGPNRPGHFNGVAQIVSKLFDIVTPDKAYFGEKDYQQLAIIRSMVKQYNYPIQIIACPIVRENDNLAMSSRNTRLTPQQREIAPKIAQTLNNSLNFVPSKTVDQVIKWVTDTLAEESMFKVEYFQIVDGITLQPVSDWNQAETIVGCIAVYCGPIRLIDNIRYK